MASKNIALVGKPGCGKSKFIYLLQHGHLSNRYYKTIGCEAHPIGSNLTVWEFGNDANVSYLQNMSGIIQIGKCPYDELPNIPILQIEKTGWNTPEDAEKILNDFVKTLQG